MSHAQPGHTSSPPPLYRAQEWYLLRAPAFPAELFVQLTAGAPTENDLIAPDGEARFQTALQQGYAMIRELVTHSPLLQSALLVASADLAYGMTRLEQEGEVGTRRSKRVASRLLRYLIRMSTRPTPFGLCAGVAAGTFAEATTLTLSEPALARVRLRPDLGWLLSLIQQLEQDQTLLPHLTLILNSTAYVAGSRVIVPQEIFGADAPHALSLEARPIIHRIMDMARHPVPYSRLADGLHHAFPSLHEASIHALLHQLWQIHLLVSTLRPPLTHPEPARFVLHQLAPLPTTQPLCHELERLLTLMAERTQQGVSALSTQTIAHVTERQKTLVLHYPFQPFQVDAALNVQAPSVQQQIAQEAARAAEILLRIGSSPRGPQALAHYRRAFVAKYGAAEVPVLQLLSTEAGLGAPSTYLLPPRESPLPQASASSHDHARDRVLSRLLAQALHTQSLEVRLTEAQIQELAQWTPTSENPAPSMLEVVVQIQACSREDLDRGTWEALVIQGLTVGGRMMGRFAGLLDESGQQSLHAYLRAEEALFPDAVSADLSYLPIQARMSNVCCRPPLHASEIAVHTVPGHSTEQVIPLDDLVVGAHRNRFYVRSLRLGKQVRVLPGHMLNPCFAPNVCRFLLDIAWDGCPTPEGFAWGLLSHLPFLPRLTSGKSVLSLAQWNLRPCDILPVGQGSEGRRWFLGLQVWRRHWHVPRYAFLTHLDHRLLLDLEHPLFAQELHGELQKCPAGTGLLLQELLPDLEHLWLRDPRGAGYVAELVVPLLLHQSDGTKEIVSPLPGRPDVHRQPAQHRAVSDRSIFPGDRWVYLKWYAASAFHDALITQSLRTLVARMYEEQLCDGWFYLRYADPEPHLRLRFHAKSSQGKEKLLLRLLEESRQLAQEKRISRLCLETYEREIERYGGPLLIEEVERFFSHNSDAMSALVAAHYRKQLPFDVRVTAVLCLDQLYHSYGWDLPTRLQYARSRTQLYEAMEAFRPVRSALTELLAPWRMERQTALMQQRTLITGILDRQEPALTALFSRMQEIVQQGELWGTQERIIDSLGHLQLNRLCGLDNEQEQQVLAFWRHTLECVHRRPPQPAEGG